ncbi:hypothetical protein ACRE_011700 [Hapsidospora chrysogenum ATCC 11550]|uniref:Uncharacterized protein n=1 Tax=Hapsidospora chrysogenum (strain ATCC 11550 / CBS 779.69 / DSM 880 / IAM 14645 / JCM 23072 / IMI 49137) TaxID=857340 RepID=A0A086TET2_HAPC1|nr:hypothetical protein ACRE_011700 [Hapsidospora chrysogenum ATCC 11550]
MALALLEDGVAFATSRNQMLQGWVLPSAWRDSAPNAPLRTGSQHPQVTHYQRAAMSSTFFDSIP